MKTIEFDDLEWASRLCKDKLVTEHVEKELQVLVHIILGNKRTLEIEYYENCVNADGTVTLFDRHPGCNDAVAKKHCPECKGAKYRGTIPELGYLFYSNSEIGIYCDVIKRFVGDKVIIPFSY